MIFQNKKYRSGVFFVVYKIEKGKPIFLIQKRKLHWKGYEFPKAGIEKGERPINTVRREVFEETGLAIKKIKNHHKRGKYFYKKIFEDRPKIIGQTWKLYSVEVLDGKIKIDEKEHYSAQWLDYKEARKKISFENQKECLDIVYNWLMKKLKY
ncbi:NUDIX domain-containing protein [archaeon]|nr:NUDIX domain-containing protein [archaeon]